MSRLGLVAALLFLGCTPDLTVQDARPFQVCSTDQDCIADSLTCDCNTPIGIAVSEQVGFEQLRGCWPPESETSCNDLPCQQAVCDTGRCSVPSNGCPSPQ